MGRLGADGLRLSLCPGRRGDARSRGKPAVDASGAARGLRCPSSRSKRAKAAPAVDSEGVAGLGWTGGGVRISERRSITRTIARMSDMAELSVPILPIRSLSIATAGQRARIGSLMVIVPVRSRQERIVRCNKEDSNPAVDLMETV